MDDTAQHTRHLHVLGALARGVDPATGSMLPEDCPYHGADIVRALHAALRALQGPGDARAAREAPARPRDPAFANAGKPWTSGEDAQLLHEYDGGLPIKECARLHLRSQAGIEARLEKLGRLSAEDRTTPRRFPLSPGAPDGQGGAVPGSSERRR